MPRIHPKSNEKTSNRPSKGVKFSLYKEITLSDIIDSFKKASSLKPALKILGRQDTYIRKVLRSFRYNNSHMTPTDLFSIINKPEELDKITNYKGDSYASLLNKVIDPTAELKSASLRQIHQELHKASDINPLSRFGLAWERAAQYFENLGISPLMLFVLTSEELIINVKLSEQELDEPFTLGTGVKIATYFEKPENKAKLTLATMPFNVLYRILATRSEEDVISHFLNASISQLKAYLEPYGLSVSILKLLSSAMMEKVLGEDYSRPLSHAAAKQIQLECTKLFGGTTTPESEKSSTIRSSTSENYYPSSSSMAAYTSCPLPTNHYCSGGPYYTNGYQYPYYLTQPGYSSAYSYINYGGQSFPSGANPRPHVASHSVHPALSAAVPTRNTRTEFGYSQNHSHLFYHNSVANSQMVTPGQAYSSSTSTTSTSQNHQTCTSDYQSLASLLFD